MTTSMRTDFSFFGFPSSHCFICFLMHELSDGDGERGKAKKQTDQLTEHISACRVSDEWEQMLQLEIYWEEIVKNLWKLALGNKWLNEYITWQIVFLPLLFHLLSKPYFVSPLNWKLTRKCFMAHILGLVSNAETRWRFINTQFRTPLHPLFFFLPIEFSHAFGKEGKAYGFIDHEKDFPGEQQFYYLPLIIEKSVTSYLAWDVTNKTFLNDKILRSLIFYSRYNWAVTKIASSLTFLCQFSSSKISNKDIIILKQQ